MVYFRINEYLDSKIAAEAQRLRITKAGFISLLVQNYFDDITFERRREPILVKSERQEESTEISVSGEGK